MIDRFTLSFRLNRKNIFQLSLFLGTVIPIAFLGIPHLHPSGTEPFKYFLLFTAIAHVPATACFYTSKEFREILIQNKLIYFTAPVALFFASGVIFVFSPQIKPFLLLFYWGWQSYHYGKQNIGMYSFISYAQDKAASVFERKAIHLSALTGILPIWKILGLQIAPQWLHSFINLSYVGGYFILAATCFLGGYILWSKRSRFTFVKAIFFILCVLFFVPAYLPGDILTTFLSYATAHAVQYIVFMAAVAEGANVLRSMYSLLLCLLLGGLIFVYLPNQIDFLAGGLLGMTMAHFVIDAHAWKLSQPNQKKFILSRFGFLMNK